MPTPEPACEHPRTIDDTTLWGIRDIAENLNLHPMSVRSLRRDRLLVKEDLTVGGKPL